MTELQIAEALERATAGVTSPPDLLDRVRAGGRRRQVRRRVVLGAGLAAVAAGSVAGAWRLGERGGGELIPSPLLDGPTRGNLAHDEKYLAKVRRAWSRHLAGNQVLGEPHVVWAAELPLGGTVAAVTQRTPTLVAGHFSRPGQPSVEQVGYGLIGFVEDAGRVISLEQLLTETDISPAALVGKARDQLVVLDDGRQIEVADTLMRWSDDGKVSRLFTPLAFRDGGVVHLPGPQTAGVRFALRSVRPGADGGRSVGLANYSALAESYGHGPSIPAPIERTLPGSAAVWPGVTPPAVADRQQWDVHNLPGYDDPYGYHVGQSAPTWYIRGATPDKRRFVVQTVGLDDPIQRLFLILKGVTFLSEIRPDTLLPIRVRLPGDQGIVVADQEAALRYRVRTGAWLPVAGDAALLPAAATEVEVVKAGGRAVVVRLA
jgi:hypothetical protein